MIAANEAVARHLIARGRPTVFRHHEDPAQSRIAMLYEQLAELGVATPPLPEGEMGGPARRAAAAAAAEAVARHLAATGGRGAEALWPLVLRVAAPGVLLGGRGRALRPREPGVPPLHLADPALPRPAGAPRPAEHARAAGGPAAGGARSWRSRPTAAPAPSATAAAVERRGDDICAAYWLRDRLSERGWDEPVEGLVTGLIDAGLFVTFEGGIVTGFLPSRRLEDDHYRADPLGVMLIGDASGRRIRLGDPIEVRVVRIEPLRGRVELEPADTPRPHRGGPRSVVPRSRRGRAGARPR